MANTDETILRSQRLQPAAPWPLLHQALRMALYDEYAARAYYAGVVQAFGQQAPFASILKSEAQHIATLVRLCQRYGVPRPLDPFPAETTISASWRVNLERGVSGELANIRLYDYLLTWVTEPDVRQAFLRVQAASRDKHLPAFQRALEKAMALENWHAQQGVAPSQAYVRHGPLSDALERGLALLASQHGAFGLIGTLVRSTHPAMLAGMVAGGAAVQLLRKAKKPSFDSSLSQSQED